MQKLDRQRVALRQLKTEETELHLRLTQVQKAIAALDGSDPQPPQNRPRCRADLLRDYLIDHPSGVRLKDVPAVLEAVGHVSFAAHPTTNWIYQLPQEKQYFVISNGVVTLRPDFNDTNVKGLVVPLQVGPITNKIDADEQGPESELRVPSAASSTGVN